MRDWRTAERMIKRDAGRTIAASGGRSMPLVIAAGTHRLPRAVMTSGMDYDDDDADPIPALATMAVALNPTRVLVGAALSRTPHATRGLLVACDTRAVADGLVEVTRAWMWTRAGSAVVWAPAQVRTWEIQIPTLNHLASAILDHARPVPADALEQLLVVMRAEGHRVRLVG